MIVIVAEKPDVGNKIAAALDKITLTSGKVVTFATLRANEKAVKAQQAHDGFLKIDFMGDECYVTWGYGHLCMLNNVSDYNPSLKSWADIPLPFVPKDYKIKLRSSKDAAWDAKVRKQFGVVSTLIKKADLVINATDYDREGEVIFAYIYEHARCATPVKRARFTSQTQSGFQEAFASLVDGREMRDIEQAGRMRGIADWVVGINLTVAMSKKHPGQGTFSVGRVQTPTLALVVKRELEIKDFKSKLYWTIDAVFHTPDGHEYKAKHKTDKFTTKSDADKTMAKILGRPGKVTSVQKKVVHKEPPLLYSQSALQMEANAKYGFTMERTLNAAQKLYDNGYATYPRTSSQYLTEDMEPEVNRVLDALTKVPAYASLISGRPRVFDRKHYFDNTKVVSHFAIIPTNNIPSGLTGDEAKIYDLIAKSVIRMLYGDATIEQTKVETTVNGEVFSSSGSVVVDPGWMVAGDMSKEDLLPSLVKGMHCDGDYSVKEKKTEPPKHYTDKTLLAAMLSAGKDLDDADLRKVLSNPQNPGIGTEATRAAIVKRLEEIGYIERSGKSIIATEKGINTIQKLPLDEVKSAELTARWEQRLNDIAWKSEDPIVFQRDIEATVAKWITEIDDKVAKSVLPKGGAPTIGATCPICGEPISVKSWGYGCSGWKNGCKFSIGHICGKKLTENQVKLLLSTGKTSLIRGFTSKSGKKFDAYLTWDGSKVGFEFPKR